MIENASGRSGPCERGELILIILSILSLPALTGPLFAGAEILYQATGGSNFGFASETPDMANRIVHVIACSPRFAAAASTFAKATVDRTQVRLSAVTVGSGRLVPNDLLDRRAGRIHLAR